MKTIELSGFLKPFLLHGGQVEVETPMLYDYIKHISFAFKPAFGLFILLPVLIALVYQTAQAATGNALPFLLYMHSQ